MKINFQMILVLIEVHSKCLVQVTEKINFEIILMLMEVHSKCLVQVTENERLPRFSLLLGKAAARKMI